MILSITFCPYNRVLFSMWVSLRGLINGQHSHVLKEMDLWTSTSALIQLIWKLEKANRYSLPSDRFVYEQWGFSVHAHH